MGEEYAYLQVADDVQRRIKTGEIKARLPGERELAEEYGVAYTTVRHAMEVLRERGLIITRHGRGTFVKPENLPGLFVPKPTRDVVYHRFTLSDLPRIVRGHPLASAGVCGGCYSVRYSPASVASVAGSIRRGRSGCGSSG
jgi:GntR family transcriptional regulator